VLEDAVREAVKLTDPSDTLIIVTSDHTNTLTINGYPKRGNNVLGDVNITKWGLKSIFQSHYLLSVEIFRMSMHVFYYFLSKIA
jgi:alkaline phosphatase